MELVFLQGAQVDIQSSFACYEALSAKRADLFLQRLEKAASLLREHPHLAPLYGGRFRRLVLRGLPQAMFYTVTGERIFIAAVLDLRQDPERLRERLGL